MTPALRRWAMMRAAALPMSPTFIPFTPWTTLASYRAFLQRLMELDLAAQIAPIQLAIRLLIPEGSLLLELPEIRRMVAPYDTSGLCYPWKNVDGAVDALCAEIQATIRREEQRHASRTDIFRKIWELAGTGPFPPDTPMASRATIPYLTEPWYC